MDRWMDEPRTSSLEFQDPEIQEFHVQILLSICCWWWWWERDMNAFHCRKPSLNLCWGEDSPKRFRLPRSAHAGKLPDVKTSFVLFFSQLCWCLNTVQQPFPQTNDPRLNYCWWKTSLKCQTFRCGCISCIFLNEFLMPLPQFQGCQDLTSHLPSVPPLIIYVLHLSSAFVCPLCIWSGFLTFILWLQRLRYPCYFTFLLW